MKQVLEIHIIEKNAQTKNIMLKASKLALVQHYKVNMIYFQSPSLD
jgi:hypothetical protein